MMKRTLAVLCLLFCLVPIGAQKRLAVVAASGQGDEADVLPFYPALVNFPVESQHCQRFALRVLSQA